MELNQNFATLDDGALDAYAAEVRAASVAAVEALSDDASDAAITEAETLADHYDAVVAEQASRIEAAEARATRAASLRERFANEPGPNADEEADDAEDDDAEDDEQDAEEPSSAEDSTEEAHVITQVPARATVSTLAKKVKRPAKPAPIYAPVVITAAADVPDFATGSKIDTFDKVGTAVVNRMKGFGTPTGDGTFESLQHYGVASFRLDFPDELTIDRHSDDMEVLTHAANEHRLPGGSLTAAGGWCAPSEVIYDLCGGASTDGMVSLPEVNVKRGGIKYTRGPDFSALYSAGFCQTEAQAIAGTTKPCYEVPCPSFTEVRLDVCGICIKVPILTNAAYPELVRAFLSEAMVAHQHAMNAKVLGAVATLAGTAASFTGLGAVSSDTLEALLLAGANIRQKYRLGLNQSLEAILPYWAKDVILVDLNRRSGVTRATDADVAAIFSAAGINVQYVYDWEELPANADAWPDTIPALVYPAGAIIKGVADVINLNAVYDAASLAQNIYTALFFEQGVLVAPMCRDVEAIEIPVCTAGRTGDHDLTCAAP